MDTEKVAEKILNGENVITTLEGISGDRMDGIVQATIRKVEDLMGVKRVNFVDLFDDDPGAEGQITATISVATDKGRTFLVEIQENKDGETVNYLIRARGGHVLREVEEVQPTDVSSFIASSFKTKIPFG